MAALTTIDDIRAYGNLPPKEKLDDTVIQPHLNSAVREITRWIGDYSGATGDKKDACKEAEACLTMAYLLPVLNTLYTEGVATIQKEIGEMELMFHSPEETKSLVEYWEERAREVLAEYIDEGDGVGRVRWYAI